jgi:hypothetical protein
MMRQLQDKPVIYLDDQDHGHYAPAEYQPGRVVYIRQAPRRQRRPNWALLFMTPFILSFMAFVFLVFAVDDLQWLMQKIAFIFVITFMGGTVLTVIFGIGAAVYDTLLGRVDYYE